MKCYRILGADHDFRERLLVLGDTLPDALARLPEAVSDYTGDELAEIETAWLESWGRCPFTGEDRWQPLQELPLHRLKARRRALEQHARRRRAMLV